MPIEVTEQYVRIRQNDPGKYTRMRTISISVAQGIKAIIGFKKEGGSEVQAYLFDKNKWTVSTAQDWIAKHKSDSLTDEWGEEYVETTFKIELRKREEFTKLKRVVINEALGVQAIIGQKNDFGNTVQAYIFDKKFWTEPMAREWIKNHRNDSLKDVILIEKLKQTNFVDAVLIAKLKKVDANKRTSLADSIMVDEWTETNDGVIFHNVVFAKEIVQRYPDGLHYKPATELRAALDSFRGKPIVAFAHPQEKIVTSLKQQAGYIVFDSVKWDPKQNRVYGSVFIKKEEKNLELIDAIKKKKLQDNSIGFNCEVVKQPGEFNGVHYDFVQKNLFIDHVAFVYQGRATSVEGVGINAF